MAAAPRRGRINLALAVRALMALMAMVTYLPFRLGGSWMLGLYAGACALPVRSRSLVLQLFTGRHHATVAPSALPLAHRSWQAPPASRAHAPTARPAKPKKTVRFADPIATWREIPARESRRSQRAADKTSLLSCADGAGEAAL